MNEKNKYLFQTPFTKLAIEKIVEEINKIIEIFNTKKKKLICVDGDNTLWGGIIGEDGINGIQCDENYPGIIYKKFQQKLLKFKDEGIVLALVSKNNLSDVKELFTNKSMPLKLDDFVTSRVNWEPKSSNISSIVDELNIGLESVLFLDDSDFELNEVKNALNIDVLKIETKEPINNLSTLEKVPSLKSFYITDEDKQKAQLYKDEKKRKEIKKSVNSLDDYIKSLNIKIEYNSNNLDNIQRITQLINKTNQFNLTTKRYTQSEVENMMKQEGVQIFDFKVSDKFGDMGLVGVVILIDDFIDTFLLSCRVLGRDIEKDILGIIKGTSSVKLKAQYIPTQKNMQVKDLYEKNGFTVTKEEDGVKLYEAIN